MATSIVSVLTKIPVKASVAMTGEITLRGRVLPIGGLKEKLLAALRGGLKTVVIPKENEKDLAEIPDNVKSGLQIVPVGHGRRGAAAGARAPARAAARGRRGPGGGRGHPAAGDRSGVRAAELRLGPLHPGSGPAGAIRRAFRVAPGLALRPPAA